MRENKPMNKESIIRISGHTYLKIDDKVADFIKNNNIVLQLNNNSLEIVAEDQIEKYWTLAANEFKREIFMNTVRPLLKSKLGYQYTEIICEQKAKLLCQKYYQAREKGEEYKGPYLL